MTAIGSAWWVKFSARSPVCVEAIDEHAARGKAAGETGCIPTSVERLPYPAEPRVGDRSECPSFCYRPQDCVGRTSCPTAPSCTS